jgi:hypothetical protein
MVEILTQQAIFGETSYGYGTDSVSGVQRKLLWKGLGQSFPITVGGPGITSVLQADGSYLITTDVNSTALSFASTADDVLVGDYLIEIQPIVTVNGTFAGCDNVVYSPATGVAQFDEAFYPDQGFGPTKANYMKNGVNTVTNVAYANSVYIERLGTVLNFYNGLNWLAALAAGPIIASTAVDGTPRSFALGTTNIGSIIQWKCRAIIHP